MRFLEEYDASGEPDETVLQDRIQSMQQQAQVLRTRRVQEYIAAFTCGGIFLVAGFAAFRILSRGARDIALRQEFSRLPN